MLILGQNYGIVNQTITRKNNKELKFFTCTWIVNVYFLSSHSPNNLSTNENLSRYWFKNYFIKKKNKKIILLGDKYKKTMWDADKTYKGDIRIINTNITF